MGGDLPSLRRAGPRTGRPLAAAGRGVARRAPLLPVPSERHRTQPGRHDPPLHLRCVRAGTAGRLAGSSVAVAVHSWRRAVDGRARARRRRGDPTRSPSATSTSLASCASHSRATPSGGDERMLELLAPYAGHRGRVARLCVSSGSAPARHAPAKPSSRSPTSDPAQAEAGLMIERTMRPLSHQSRRPPLEQRARAVAMYSSDIADVNVNGVHCSSTTRHGGCDRSRTVTELGRGTPTSRPRSRS